MRVIDLTLVFVVLVTPFAAEGAGFAHNENFMVLAHDQRLAEEVLARADQFRKEVAQEWLGSELPPSVGPAIINVELSDDEDRGLTWAIDSPDRKYHKIWLTTSFERALGSTLHHEIAHVVLATRFPNSLPEWAEEGAASLSDDHQRVSTRERITKWYAQTGNWPDLKKVFDAEIIAPDDQATYSVAASLTRYLLSRADKTTFLAFASTGKEKGWDRALKEHYGFGSVGELQATWQAWAGQDSRAAGAITPSDSRHLAADAKRRS